MVNLYSDLKGKIPCFAMGIPPKKIRSKSELEGAHLQLRFFHVSLPCKSVDRSNFS